MFLQRFARWLVTNILFGNDSNSLSFVVSVVSEGDLHKRLLFTMWNSDSSTRYLLGTLMMLSVEGDDNRDNEDKFLIHLNSYSKCLLSRSCNELKLPTRAVKHHFIIDAVACFCVSGSVCAFLCMAVCESGRANVLLSPPCLTRLKQKQGHCRGWRTYGRMSHKFLVLSCIERTDDEKHRYVLRILEMYAVFS